MVVDPNLEEEAAAAGLITVITNLLLWFRVNLTRCRHCFLHPCAHIIDCMLMLLEAGELMVVDPNLEEEAAAAGLMTVIMNPFGELCAVQKTSGIGLPATEVHSPFCVAGTPPSV